MLTEHYPSESEKGMALCCGEFVEAAEECMVRCFSTCAMFLTAEGSALV